MQRSRAGRSPGRRSLFCRIAFFWRLMFSAVSSSGVLAFHKNSVSPSTTRFPALAGGAFGSPTASLAVAWQLLLPAPIRLYYAGAALAQRGRWQWGAGRTATAGGVVLLTRLLGLLVELVLACCGPSFADRGPRFVQARPAYVRTKAELRGR